METCAEHFGSSTPRWNQRRAPSIVRRTPDLARTRRVLYYRLSERDSGGNVLRRGTVHATAIR